MRDKLIEELSKIMPCSCIDAYKLRKISAPDCCNCNYIEDIVYWVIQDRKRIVEPLVKLDGAGDDLDKLKAINETMRNAGII